MRRKFINSLRFNVCPLCGSEEIKIVGKIQYSSLTVFSTIEIELTEEPELWNCQNCLSSFTQNVVPENITNDLYQQSNANQRWSQIPFSEAKSSKIITELSNIFSMNSIVLDYGCNTGELLDFAKSFKCRTSGIELSHSSNQILMNKGHKFFNSFDHIENNSIDVITAFDLIEHLYDVPLFLEEAYSKLRKNGYLIILTGNITSLPSKLAKSKWWYVSYPEHIIFPSITFFSKFTKFKLDKTIYTYASRGYEFSPSKHILALFKSFLKHKYNGLPSLIEDHCLLILRKV